MLELAILRSNHYISITYGTKTTLCIDFSRLLTLAPSYHDSQIPTPQSSYHRKQRLRLRNQATPTLQATSPTLKGSDSNFASMQPTRPTTVSPIHQHVQGRSIEQASQPRHFANPTPSLRHNQHVHRPYTVT